MNRKLIRPDLRRLQERRRSSLTTPSTCRGAAPRAPRETNAEANYYLKQMANQTRMVIVLKDGERDPRHDRVVRPERAQGPPAERAEHPADEGQREVHVQGGGRAPAGRRADAGVSAPPRLALSIGDPAGIGPEIVLQRARPRGVPEGGVGGLRSAGASSPSARGASSCPRRRRSRPPRWTCPEGRSRWVRCRPRAAAWRPQRCSPAARRRAGRPHSAGWSRRR